MTSDKSIESIEMNWEVGPITIYGTMVKPAGSGPFPAVAMVAGSGPTDRDWNSPLLPGTNGSAHLLAEVLARHGIASLRYDKCATGPHVRENIMTLMGKLSMQVFADELAGAVRILASQTDIRKDRIYGLGNSEGTLHVLHYQINNPDIPLAGIILSAPPGQPVGTVAHAQIAAQTVGLPDGAIILSLYDDAIARWQAGEPAAPDPRMPQAFQQVLQSLEAPANLPFARELWTADAAPLLGLVSVPVLVVIGKKDIQVDWQTDGNLLQKAVAGKENVGFFFPDNTNHILKYEPKARVELVAAEVAQHYNAADAQLDPEAVDYILNWLNSKI